MVITSTIIVKCMLIIFCTSIVQGISGFGFALLAVPLLSFVLPSLIQITPLIVIYSLITNLVIISRYRNHIELKKIFILIVFGIIGIPAGLYLLLKVNVLFLKLILGIIITITSFTLYRDYKVNIKSEFFSFSFVGLLSGILNGSCGLSGPPVVLFLTNRGSDKNTFKANLTIYGIITNIFAIINFLYSGIITNSTFKIELVTLPALLLGTVIGVKVSDFISEHLFKKFILLLIGIMGIYTFISSLLSLIKG